VAPKFTIHAYEKVPAADEELLAIGSVVLGLCVLGIQVADPNEG
jgi:hypothetical protein